MVQSYKMGPGTLNLGAGPLAVSAQVASCQVTPSENVSEGEVIPVLSGDELREDDEVTYTFVLSGNVVQDIDAAGFVAYTWENKGEEHAFTFIPSTAEGRKVTGTCRIVPVVIGGEVKKRNRSDFSFRCVGDDPVLGDVA